MTSALIGPALAEEIVDAMRALGSAPELPALEVKSAALLAEWVERHGFIVTRGVGGIPTAFAARGRSGPGGPSIGILAEYDGLPGLDNAPVAWRQAGPHRAGQACGHNQIGAANAGAAIAALASLRAARIPAEIIVFGCPAEEILWGKIAMLAAGVFNGVDVVLTSHGDYQNGVLSRPCQSVVSGEIVFTGIAGHGGSVRRQNALDAAELAVQSLERLRAHNFPDTNLEHVLRRAGVHPAITPDEARIWFSARHVDYDRAAAVYEFAVGVCARAAEMTGTTSRAMLISSSRGYLPNDTLAAVLFARQREVGPPRWRAADIAWMTELSLACTPREAFALDRDIALHVDGVDPYGQDDGEISWRIPLGRVNWAFPRGVPLHHWGLSALAGHGAGDAGPLMAAEVLARGALDLAQGPDVIAAAKAELSARTAGRTIDPPRCGAMRTLTQTPEAFWNATWLEG